MIITCVFSQNVPYLDPQGVQQMCTLRPGRHNYPMLKPKGDPLLESTLFVLRKHGKIAFDDLLPSDQKVLKSAPAGVDPAKHLAEKVMLKPNPRGRKVLSKGKKKSAVKDEGPRQENSAPPASAQSAGDGGKRGKVSAGKK
jgi:hypothetical protein